METAKIARTITIAYLLLVFLSFFIMIITLDSTPMAGIFLVLLTYPWPTIVGMLGDGSPGNSALINGLLLLAGGILNGFLLYVLIRLAVRLAKGRG